MQKMPDWRSHYGSRGASWPLFQRQYKGYPKSPATEHQPMEQALTVQYHQPLCKVRDRDEKHHWHLAELRRHDWRLMGHSHRSGRIATVLPVVNADDKGWRIGSTGDFRGVFGGTLLDPLAPLASGGGESADHLFKGLDCIFCVK